VPDALRSTLFEWSADRFSQPLNEVNAAVDASSHEYLAASWRRARNEELVEKVSQRQRRAPKKFDEQIAILKQPVGAVAKLLFHPSEDILVVGDDRDSIHLWRWRDGRRLRTWVNSGNFHTRTTALTFINENDHALLLVGSHDGVVRLWDLRDGLDGSAPEQATTSALPTVADATGASPLVGGYVGVDASDGGGSSGRRQRGVRLAAAWRGLSDAVAYQRRGGAGMVVSWQQGHGLLMVSGDVTFVRAWDAQHELAVQDIPTHASSSVTCLASDQRGGHLVVAGCGDGSVRLFDWRVPPALLARHHARRPAGLGRQCGDAAARRRPDHFGHSDRQRQAVGSAHRPGAAHVHHGGRHQRRDDGGRRAPVGPGRLRAARRTSASRCSRSPATSSAQFATTTAFSASASGRSARSRSTRAARYSPLAPPTASSRSTAGRQAQVQVKQATCSNCTFYYTRGDGGGRRRQH
jgi:hypothetical protein